MVYSFGGSLNRYIAFMYEQYNRMLKSSFRHYEITNSIAIDSIWVSVIFITLCHSIPCEWTWVTRNCVETRRMEVIVIKKKALSCQEKNYEQIFWRKFTLRIHVCWFFCYFHINLGSWEKNGCITTQHLLIYIWVVQINVKWIYLLKVFSRSPNLIFAVARLWSCSECL